MKTLSKNIQKHDQLEYINLILTLKSKLRNEDLNPVQKMETYNDLCNLYSFIDFKLIQEALEK